MKQTKWDLYWEKLDYYPLMLIAFAFLGIFGYLLLSKEHKKNPVIKLSFGILVLIAFYENLAEFLMSQKLSNSWIYNIFNSHIATILFFLLIKSFLKQRNHRIIVRIFMALFLLISLVLHLFGFVDITDGGEYISFLNTIFILCSCGMYFYELLTLDDFLEINPLREFSFWASTAILFYFSSSFMIYISYTYLYTHHGQIFWMVREIPRAMTILCNLLLSFSILSLVIKERFQMTIIHV